MKFSLVRLLSPVRLFLVGAVVAPSLGAAMPQGVGVQGPESALPGTAVSGSSAALDRHGKLHYSESGDQTWVRGRTFKASLSADGFTYIPFLGSSAPQNYPVRFRLVAATLAGEVLPLSDQAAVTRIGDRFVLDRGSVDVIYDVSLEQVEQSFSLDAAGAAGDLVLELSVESELEGRPRGGGLAFRGEEGGVDYGAAIVLDGAGGRADVPVRLSGERLELTVPAAFLQSATGPILVDPFISTYVVDDYVSTMDNVDVSFDVTFSQATYVWEDYFSLADVDVYSRTFDTDTNTLISGVYVDSSTDSWIHPRIANLARVDLGLVVAQKVDATTGVHSIVGCYFVESDRLFGPPQTLAVPSDGFRYGRPDLGGDNNVNATDPRFMLGWEESNVLGQPTGVFARYVRPSGYYGPIRSLTGAGVGWHVAISKGNSSRAGLDNWNVVYGFAPTWQGTSYVAYAQLDTQGVPLVSGTVHTSQPGSLPYDLDVSESIVAGGFAPKHLISFTESNPASVSSKRMILHNGTSVLKDFDLHEMEHRVSGPRSFGTRVATTWHAAGPPEFVVAYHEELPGGQSGVFVTNLDSYGNRALAISEVATLAGASTPWGPSNGSVALASLASGGAESQLSLLAWTRPNPTTGVFDIAGATHDAFFATAVGQQYCTGTLNSSARKGFLAAYGDSSVTGPKQLFASYLPPGSVGFFLAGMGDTSIPFPGGSVGTLCLGGSSIGRYSDSAAISNSNGAIVLNIDPTVISTANGTTAATAGQRWNFQLWHRDSVGGQATSNFTNAVSIDFL